MPEYEVKQFRSAAVGLKELERFIRNGNHLMTGRAFASVEHLRSRELLVNWLICAVANKDQDHERWKFCTDPSPDPCDGVIYDTDTREGYRMEHVMAVEPYEGEKKAIGELILGAVDHKAKRGEEYAQGKMLAVFLFTKTSSAEPWYPNRVARELPQHEFMQVWFVNLHEASEGIGYAYNVVVLDAGTANAPIWRVHINDDFQSWTVKTVQ